MKKTKLAIAIAATGFFSTSALATNGMNMEGYGPISTAMGGTASAFNNGLGGMMNNPATMGMGAKEGNKFQLAIGKLGPDVNAKRDNSDLSAFDIPDINQDSGGNAYYMPGFGYATKKNGLTWGIGILGQGGMGTEYGKANSPSDIFSGGASLFNNGQTNPGFDAAIDGVALSGQENRSELSVGRIIIPVNYEVSNQLTVGASLDYVWAGMDIMMDFSGQQFGNLAFNNFATPGQTLSGNVSGSMFNTLLGSLNPLAGDDIRWARFDFSNDDKYSGQAKGTGFGAKLGMTYKVSDQLTLGASYHSKTRLSNLKGDATLSFDAAIAGFGLNEIVPLEGEIEVKDFQWPSTIAFGAAYRPNDKWLLTADYKRINWSETMKDFNMVFKADATQSNPFAQGFVSSGGTTLDVTLPQEWNDQNIVMLGAAYKVNKQLTVRGGLNVANNPVPDEHVNPLFPATVERHYTAGFGYNFDKSHSIDASLTHAPATKVKGDGLLNNGIEISHGQTNWQLMYTYKWGIVK